MPQNMDIQENKSLGLQDKAQVTGIKISWLSSMFFPKGFEMEQAHCFFEIILKNMALSGHLQRWGRNVGFPSYNPSIIWARSASPHLFPMLSKSQ